MTTTSSNYWIAPSDGWVTVAPTASKFIRTSAFPHTHPYYLYFGSSAPALVGTQGSGTFTFSGGIPSNAQVALIGNETYTFKTTPVAATDVQIVAATPGTALISFTGLPSNTQTIVIGTDTYEAVTSGATSLQFNIGASAILTATNFATAVGGSSIITAVDHGDGTVTVTSVANSTTGNYTITNSLTNVTAPATMTGGQDGSLLTATNFTTVVNANSKLVTASDTSGVVTVTSILAASIGNYTISTTGTHVTASGSAMTSGADVGMGVLVCHKPFFMNITTDAKLWARIVNPAPSNPNIKPGAIRLDVVSVQ